jgi:hypothetical protein
LDAVTRQGKPNKRVLVRRGLLDTIGLAPSVEDRVMSIVVRFNPTSLTTQKYDESVRRLAADGLWPADGCDCHVCFGSDGELKVSEIWDSREQLEAFGGRLAPMLSDVGIEFSSDPEIFEIHNVFRRS